MSDIVWRLVNICYEVTVALEAYETQEEPNAELAEVKQTVQRSKSLLLPYVSTQRSDPVFDATIQGLFGALEGLKQYSVGLEDGSDTERFTRKCNLFRTDLLLSLRCDQFEAMFPTPEITRTAEELISDRAGAALWSSFGKNVLMVPWKSFQQYLEGFLSIRFGDDENYVRNFLDCTRDGFVTPFEFNLFLRWFGPLHGMLERVSTLARCGALAGFIPAFEASHLLSDQEPGTYLVRFSKTKVGAFALTYVDHARAIKHSLIHSNPYPPYGVTIPGAGVSKSYESLHDFLTKNHCKLKTPLGVCWIGHLQEYARTTAQSTSAPPPNLTLVEQSTPPRITPTILTQEQPAKVEVEKQLCIVCMDAEIDTVFLECGHMSCCRECSSKLRKCPICREPIARVVPVFRA